jgi:hypothetical protein
MLHVDVLPKQAQSILPQHLTRLTLLAQRTQPRMDIRIRSPRTPRDETRTVGAPFMTRSLRHEWAPRCRRPE